MTLINGLVPATAAEMINHSIQGKETDRIKNEINQYTQGKHVLLFCGFSGLGYARPTQLQQDIVLKLERAINKYDIGNIVVVAGATAEGIGVVYQLAKQLALATLGIVSAQAKDYCPLSEHCDHIVFVDGPQDSWEVLDQENKSYMVYAVTAGVSGEAHIYGGGNVTLAELKEVEEYGISKDVQQQWLPDEREVEKRRKKDVANGRMVDYTPVKSWCEQEKT